MVVILSTPLVGLGELRPKEFLLWLGGEDTPIVVLGPGLWVFYNTHQLNRIFLGGPDRIWGSRGLFES